MTDVIDNTNIRAFLMTIRRSEGTDGPDGYRTMFGGRLFDSYSEHPQQYFTYVDRSGRVLKTSAAGAYQIVYSTWFNLKNKLELLDFSPVSQDKAAIELLRECGALDGVIAGRIDDAIEMASHTWASLPGAGYSQPEHTPALVAQWYLQCGGSITY